MAEPTVRESMLYEALPGLRVRCNTCPWCCRLEPDKLGVCRMRVNREGKLYVLNYGLASSANVDPIEKKPLYHFYPGSLCFSLGTWGCNFHCLHCQNWEIACCQPWEVSRGGQYLAPEIAIELTLRQQCRGISWTYNEPTIWFEYTYDCARLAKEKGLYTVYVTNGYITAEALDLIGPYLDAFRVDIKGFSDEFYLKLAKITRWREVLSRAVQAKVKWGMHVEVVTNIIPTWNDDVEQLQALATWIKENLGELTPWHITRFFPNYQLQHLPPTTLSSLERAWEIGKKAGLAFVYVGNLPGSEKENTLCYSCGQLLIQRVGYHTKIRELTDSHCPKCGAEANIRR